MSALEYLESVSEKKKEIKAIEFRLKALKSAATGISGMNYENGGVTGCRPTEAPFVRFIGLIQEAEKELEKTNEELIKLTADVCNLILTLDDKTDQSILISFYLENNNINKTAGIVGYTVPTVKKRKKQAIDLLNKKLEDIKS